MLTETFRNPPTLQTTQKHTSMNVHAHKLTHTHTHTHTHKVCCVQTVEWDGHREPTAAGSIEDCISIPHLATMRPFLWQPAAER